MNNSTIPASRPALAAEQKLGPGLVPGLALQMALAALCVGCSLTPHYVRPAAPVAATYPGTGDAQPAPGGAAASQIAWRAFFPDSRLQRYIALALANNRDLRGSALHIEEARALYGVQAADRLPNLNLNAGGSRARVPAVQSTTGAPYLSQSYTVGANLAAFELDFFGRVKSLSDSALAQYLATREARDAFQISLVAEVAKAYLSERAYAEQYVLALRTASGRDAGYRLTQRRFDAGAASRLDLRLAETLLFSARASLLTLARQRAQSVNALSLLVGAPLTDIEALPATPDKVAFEAAAGSPLTAAIAEIPPGLPSALLQQRPDIRAAEQRLMAANANIGAARAAFFPRIALTAGVGSSSSELSGLFDSGSGSWSFAPQLILPLFDAGRNRGNLELAKVRTELAVVDYEKTIQVAFREVADALVARDLLEQQVAAQRAVQAAEAERLMLSNLRFKNGIASSLDVLDAERELFTAEQTLVQVQLLRQTNAIDLYRALGGGLEQRSQAEAPHNK